MKPCWPALWVFMVVATILTFVQLKLTDRPLLLAERFFNGGGWLTIPVISFYGAMVAYHMHNPANVPRWRQRTWTIFATVFFVQLIMGLLGVEKFLMTGKLHLPIPMMILAGPVYRSELSFMTILFLSTIILSGSAWCSHFCYFGALDQLASGKMGKTKPLKRKTFYKTAGLSVVVITALALRWAGISALYTTLIAALFGVGGLFIMLLVSKKLKVMAHCVLYCPVGTLVSLLKRVNPFRLTIDNSCTYCNRCTLYCRYDALNLTDIRNKKPALSCTLCGDCLSACRPGSIKYRFLTLQPETARNLYLVTTISIHAVFLALARI